MSRFITRFNFGILLVSVLLFVASCTNFEKVYQKNFDFPAADSSKFDKTDGNSGKMFDILTGTSTGINFINQLKFGFLQDNNLYVNYYNGGGVGVMNVNGDSLPDLYFSGNQVPDAVYINEGNMHFKDISANSGIFQKNKGWSTGVSVADVNNDGYDDIYVCRSRWKDSLSNLLYINKGNNTFTEVGKQYGVDCPDCYTMGAVFFDYDNDGDLDLYVKNHPSDWIERMRFNNLEKVEKGTNQSDKFYRNDGNGHFTDMSKQAGINNHGYGLAVCAADLNDDGWQDIYGCNDFAMYDYVYMNNKNGTFADESRNILNKTSMFSMGVDIADFNNDGFQDIVTADMRFNYSYVRRSFALGLRRNEFNNMTTSGYGYQYVKNTLQLNNGDGTFSEIANLAGTDATDWSWGPLFADFDNDGWKDVFIPNGYYRWLNVDERELYQAMKDATRRKDSVAYNKLYKMVNKKKLEDPDFIFKNNHDLTFTDESQTWGINLPNINHGAAFADLDKDGDLDLIVSNTDRTPFIYRNNEEKLVGNNWIEFDFKGESKNLNAIGAKVHIWSNSGMQFGEHHVVRGYQSSSENFMHFGLAKDDSVKRVVVEWPDGKTEELFNLKVNQLIALNYKNATNRKIDLHPKYNRMFTESTDKLGIDYVHQENDYEDFTKELLLPHKLSRYGPGLAVADVNNDGLEDFYVGGAQQHPGALYLQAANKKFEKASQQPWDQDKMSESLGVLFFDADGDGDMDLYMASGGNEYKADDVNLEDLLYLNDGKGNFTRSAKALPEEHISNSCAVAGDFDNDGDLDLFLGGRVVPGNYPYPAKSTILRNDKGTFKDVTSEIAPMLDKIGLVCGAIWSDYNSDGKLDIIIAGEWTPITVLKNTGGKFENATKEAGLENYTGWWNSIVAGDFDNDGDIDYVAGNEGLNSRYYKPTATEPVECYAADFDKNGTNDLLMSVYNHGKAYPVKTRMTMAEQVPMLGKKFELYKQFALATTPEVFGQEALDKSYHLIANTFASSYIENQGNGTFAVRPLPVEAQFSCLYGMVPYDVNNDGNLDIIAHGNFYNTESETERDDACIGLVMLGDGKGSFSSQSVQQTGFLSKKDAKALAMIYVGKDDMPVLMGTNNNSKMFAYEITNNAKNEIRLTEQDKYADIFYKDSRKSRFEPNIGSGFLSENSKMLSFMAPLVDKVVATNYKGEQRVVYQSGVLASK
ncbi:MAG: VCBS repeat-containing protein [Chitinophagales bacterium]|nr:VCBS repeat-containing protein [Chitinophagales bacterium]